MSKIRMAIKPLRIIHCMNCATMFVGNLVLFKPKLLFRIQYKITSVFLVKEYMFYRHKARVEKDVGLVTSGVEDLVLGGKVSSSSWLALCDLWLSVWCHC